MPKGNQYESEGGADGESPLASAKSTHKAVTSLSKSKKSCPCVAYTVRHISNIVRIEEDDDVDGGGSTTAVGSKNSSVGGSPVGGSLDALPVDNSTLGRLELAFN